MGASCVVCPSANPARQPERRADKVTNTITSVEDAEVQSQGMGRKPREAEAKIIELIVFNSGDQELAAAIA